MEVHVASFPGLHHIQPLIAGSIVQSLIAGSIVQSLIAGSIVQSLIAGSIVQSLIAGSIVQSDPWQYRPVFDRWQYRPVFDPWQYRPVFDRWQYRPVFDRWQYVNTRPGRSDRVCNESNGVFCHLCRNTKKCRDKISSLEKDLQDTETRIEELKVCGCACVCVRVWMNISVFECVVCMSACVWVCVTGAVWVCVSPLSLVVYAQTCQCVCDTHIVEHTIYYIVAPTMALAPSSPPPGCPHRSGR